MIEEVPEAFNKAKVPLRKALVDELEIVPELNVSEESDPPDTIIAGAAPVVLMPLLDEVGGINGNCCSNITIRIHDWR